MPSAPAPTSGIALNLVISDSVVASIANILGDNTQAERRRMEAREAYERDCLRSESLRADAARQEARERAEHTLERDRVRAEHAEHRQRTSAESLLTHLLEEKQLGRDIAMELLAVGKDILKQKLASAAAANSGATATPEREAADEYEYDLPTDPFPFSNPWDSAPDGCRAEPPFGEEEPTAGAPEAP